MPSKKNLFRCIVVPSPVDNHSYRDFPKTSKQRYEVTKDEAKRWCKNAIGKPIQAGHIDNVSIGIVKNSFTNNQGMWYVDIELDDSLAGNKAELDIRKGSVNCVSLAHYPSTGEVKEISLVNIPAREGSNIIGDIVQASGANLSTNEDYYNKLFTIQEINNIDYHSLVSADIDNNNNYYYYCNELVMASANPSVNGFQNPVPNGQVAHSGFNSSPVSSLQELEKKKFELEQQILSLKQQSHMQSQVQSHPHQQQQQQQQQQYGQMNTTSPYYTASNAGPLGMLTDKISTVYNTTQLKNGQAPVGTFTNHGGLPMATCLVGAMNAFNNNQHQVQSQSLNPNPNQMIQASATSTSPVSTANTNPFINNTGFESNSSLSATPFVNSVPLNMNTNQTTVDTNNNIHNQASTTPTSNDAESHKSQDKQKNTFLNSNATTKGQKRHFILPPHIPANSTDQEYTEWVQNCYAQTHQFIENSDATHEAKNEIMANARKHIESAKEKHELAKKTNELIKQESDLKKYNLNMLIDKLKNNSAVDQQELNKIQQEYEQNAMSHDVAQQLVHTLELRAKGGDPNMNSHNQANKLFGGPSSPYEPINPLTAVRAGGSYAAQYQQQYDYQQQQQYAMQQMAQAAMEAQHITRAANEASHALQQAAQQAAQQAQQAEYDSHKNALWELTYGKSSGLNSGYHASSSISSSSGGMNGHSVPLSHSHPHMGQHPILASASSMNSYGNTYDPSSQTYNNTNHKGALMFGNTVVYDRDDPVNNVKLIRENWKPELVKASAAAVSASKFNIKIPSTYKSPFLNANGCAIRFVGDLPWEATGAHPVLANLLNNTHGNLEFTKKSDIMTNGTPAPH